MLNKIIKKRAQVLTLILVLSVFLTAMTASAATERIGKKGGIIDIADGVDLVVPEGAIEGKPIEITADMYWKGDSIEFDFGPSPMTFELRLRLRITWEALEEMGLDTFTLYAPGWRELQPTEHPWGLLWKIKHFSLYYCRRR